MKIRYYAFGLLLATLVALLGFNSRNAQAESQPSQCQRFETALIRYNDRISDTSNDPPNRQGIAENLLMDLNTEVESLESQTFTDATLRSLHQRFLAYITAGRDHVATYLNATQQGEPARAEAGFNNLQQLPYQVSEVVQQFEQYCGGSSNNL